MIRFLPTTVANPVKGEERNLGAFRERRAKVVVFDSGSTDSSKEIAQRASADWIDFCWNGRFSKKRN